jgi:hypothetical protein
MSELDVSPTSSRRWIGTRTTSLTDRVGAGITPAPPLADCARELVEGASRPG